MRMRGSRRSLLRQASVLIVLCCAFAVGASQALAQDPAPEPAPPNSSGPKPEAPPGAKSQPETPATPPPPPASQPPPPAATNPPPAAVTPPPAPVVVVSQPPPAPVRSESRVQKSEPTKPKPKNTKPKPEHKVTQTAAPALGGISREEATSPDTLLMVGGLALFFLVLADVVFLTLSTRVLRTR
jgi:hypothetical protein